MQLPLEKLLCPSPNTGLGFILSVLEHPEFQLFQSPGRYIVIGHFLISIATRLNSSGAEAMFVFSFIQQIFIGHLVSDR